MHIGSFQTSFQIVAFLQLWPKTLMGFISEDAEPTRELILEVKLCSGLLEAVTGYEYGPL